MNNTTKPCWPAAAFLEFTYSSCVSMGFLPQSKDMQVKLNWRLSIVRRGEWLYLSICQPCDRLVTYAGCTSYQA